MPRWRHGDRSPRPAPLGPPGRRAGVTGGLAAGAARRPVRGECDFARRVAAAARRPGVAGGGTGKADAARPVAESVGEVLGRLQAAGATERAAVGQPGSRACRATIDDTLRASIHRMSARDGRFWGAVLGPLRAAAGMAPDEHAAALGLMPTAYALLALCWRPRPGREADDMASVAGYAGIDVAVLAGFLRAAAGSA